MRKLIILGSGGYGRVIADIVIQSEQYESISFLDDNDTREDVIGRCADYKNFIDANTDCYPAFGNNILRLQWMEQLLSEDVTVPTIIHSSAYISPTAQVNRGTVVLPRAIVNSYTVIKKGCIVNIGAIIDHNCVVEDGAHICLGAIVKADNHIPSCTKIEAGTVIENGAYKSEEY